MFVAGRSGRLHNRHVIQVTTARRSPAAHTSQQKAGNLQLTQVNSRQVTSSSHRSTAGRSPAAHTGQQQAGHQQLIQVNSRQVTCSSHRSTAGRSPAAHTSQKQARHCRCSPSPMVIYTRLNFFDLRRLSRHDQKESL